MRVFPQQMSAGIRALAHASFRCVVIVPGRRPPMRPHRRFTSTRCRSRNLVTLEEANLAGSQREVWGRSPKRGGGDLSEVRADSGAQGSELDEHVRHVWRVVMRTPNFEVGQHRVTLFRNHIRPRWGRVRPRNGRCLTQSLPSCGRCRPNVAPGCGPGGQRMNRRWGNADRLVAERRQVRSDADCEVDASNAERIVVVVMVTRHHRVVVVVARPTCIAASFRRAMLDTISQV